MTDKLGARASHQALAVPVEPVSRLDPSGLGIHGEAVAGYGRKCRVCGGVAAFEQLNRYWHHERNEDGENVVWLPGRYCSRACMESSPLIDWRRVAIAMEARQRRDAEERPDPKDDSAGRLRHRPDTPSLQTPQGGDS